VISMVLVVVRVTLRDGRLMKLAIPEISSFVKNCSGGMFRHGERTFHNQLIFTCALDRSPLSRIPDRRY